MRWHDWIRTVEVEPSLYAADFARLGEQIDALVRTGARIFHFDVADGHFVPPITVGPIVLESIAPMIHARGGVIDCHLMTETPERHFAAIAAAGGDSVTFHFEAVDDVAAVVAEARKHELGVGIAFKPETSPEDVAAVSEGVDIVLCMSIDPGYSGQDFMPEALERVRALGGLLPPEIHVQVDGGISNENIRSIHDAGATLLVAGTAIFGREDLPRAYRRLLHALA